jgi:hypothetical protein
VSGILSVAVHQVKPEVSIMKTNRTIRIIKGAERGSQPGGVVVSPEQKNENRKPATRDVSLNVAAWVKEFRQRRHADPRRAFASLFNEPATQS